MWLGLPVLGAAAAAAPGAVRDPRASTGRELAKLTFTNMIVWHVVAILAVQALSSGRAAILGYTMPIFSALLGRRDVRRAADAAPASPASPPRRVGVALLLWHEFGALSGKPLAALGMLLAAAVWALGTQQMRRTTIAGADPGDRVLDDASPRTLVMTLLARCCSSATAGIAPRARDLGGDRLQRAR